MIFYVSLPAYHKWVSDHRPVRFVAKKRFVHNAPAIQRIPSWLKNVEESPHLINQQDELLDREGNLSWDDLLSFKNNVYVAKKVIYKSGKRCACVTAEDKLGPTCALFKLLSDEPRSTRREINRLCQKNP